MRAAAYREHDPEQMNRDRKLRNLILVLGDQLDERSAAFDGFDPRADAVWMAEVAHESEKVWVSKPRIAIFLAAMRHFRGAMLERGWRVLRIWEHELRGDLRPLRRKLRRWFGAS